MLSGELIAVNVTVRLIGLIVYGVSMEGLALNCQLVCSDRLPSKLFYCWSFLATRKGTCEVAL